jgi:hypothetical protein
MGVCGVSRTTATHLQLAWWQHKRLQQKKKTTFPETRKEETRNYLSPLTFS